MWSEAPFVSWPTGRRSPHARGGTSAALAPVWQALNGSTFPFSNTRLSIHVMNRNAVLYALISAALFGMSTPAAKLLVGSIHPVTLAGLLYCGAGIGVAALRRLLSAAVTGAPETALSRTDLPWLAAAIGAGGILGPLLLMFGLTRTDAATASLLLTLEGVATALMAWFIFHENFDRRIAIGMASLVAGAGILSWSGAPSFDSLAGPLAIAGACVSWGLDNNLTRKVSLADPLQIAMLKGLIAGPFNLVLGLSISHQIPTFSGILLTGIVGFLGYGVSLALFVVALRGLGTARTGAYFSTAPFIGSAVAVVVLGEPVTARLLAAGALMAFGVWLHLTEHHEHEHIHELLVHAHPHVHDIHHQHAHSASDPPGEPHTHSHEHRPIRHAHPHVPDMHHTHRHS
jgi:drug/metabolite transporter (DMT)-like permease